MVKITHILKSGEVLEDITGHLVKKTDCPTVYSLMERSINEKRDHSNGITDPVRNLSNGN